MKNAGDRINKGDFANARGASRVILSPDQDKSKSQVRHYRLQVSQFSSIVRDPLSAGVSPGSCLGRQLQGAEAQPKRVLCVYGQALPTINPHNEATMTQSQEYERKKALSAFYREVQAQLTEALPSPKWTHEPREGGWSYWVTPEGSHHGSGTVSLRKESRFSYQTGDLVILVEGLRESSSHKTIPKREYKLRQGNEKGNQKALAQAIALAHKRAEIWAQDCLEEKESDKARKEYASKLIAAIKSAIPAELYKEVATSQWDAPLNPHPTLVDGQLFIGVTIKQEVSQATAMQLFSILGDSIQVSIKRDITPEQYLALRALLVAQDAPTT